LEHCKGKRKKACYQLFGLLMAAIVAIMSMVTVSADQINDISQVVSDAYILMDAQTGQILAQKNAEKVKYPASITKIMTLALTLQNGSLQDTITVSQAAVELDYNVSHVALQPGEIITVQDAVMATLLASANDAANCLAEYVSGSTAAFADLMNQIAVQIGCTDTHFVNANGLPEDDHYTTAHDMARITAWALTVPGFREVFATDSYTMSATNLQPEERRWATQNAMFVYSAFQYEGAWGGKLGWTEQANHTMVTTLTCKGRDLILVTMDCQKKYQKYWDGICILDTALEQLEPLCVPEGTAAAAEVAAYEGEQQVGKAYYSQKELTVWVPVGTTVQQLSFHWQTPQQVGLWDISPIPLTVSLPPNSLTETEMTFLMGQDDLQRTDSEWQTLQLDFSQSNQSKGPMNSLRGWQKVGITVCGLVLLTFSVRWVNRLRKKLRRKRKYKRIKSYRW